MDLFFRQYGQGPPLVILHGLLGAGSNWVTLARRVFGSYFTVYVPDQRNHGQSGHGEAFDYMTLADDIEDFFDARGLERAHVIGHSMGGKAAMEFALTRPKRVERLVVVDIAPRAYPDRHSHILQAMKSVDPSSFDRRDGIEAALAARLTDPKVVQLMLKNVDRGEDGLFRWAVNLEAIEHGYPQIRDGLETWNTWDGPALFVRGERSDYLAEGDMELVRSYFPNARLDTVPAAGHWVHADHPAAFSRLVLEFLGVEHPGHRFEEGG